MLSLDLGGVTLVELVFVVVEDITLWLSFWGRVTVCSLFYFALPIEPAGFLDNQPVVSLQWLHLTDFGRRTKNSLSLWPPI